MQTTRDDLMAAKIGFSGGSIGNYAYLGHILKRQYPRLSDKLQLEIKLLGITPNLSPIVQNGRITGLVIRDRIIPKTLLEIPELNYFEFIDFQFNDLTVEQLSKFDIKYLILENPENIELLKDIQMDYLIVIYKRDVNEAEEKTIINMISNCRDYNIYIKGYTPKLTNYDGVTHLNDKYPRWGMVCKHFEREVFALENACNQTLVKYPKFNIPGIGNEQENSRPHIPIIGNEKIYSSSVNRGIYFEVFNSKISRIGIPHSNLDEFPEILLGYPDLKYLDLSNNNFNSIPEEIYEFKSLETLYISGNKIDKFDERLGEMKLHTLVISHNNLDDIPAYMGNIESIDYIDVSHNKITRFPVEFFINTSAKFIFLEGQGIDITTQQVDRVKHERNKKTICRIDISINPNNKLITSTIIEQLLSGIDDFPIINII